MSEPPAARPNPDQPRITHRLLLFVANQEPNSLQAHQNLLSLCNSELSGRYELQVIDIFEEDKPAQSYGVLVAPCLVRLEPLPTVMIAGTLSDTEKLRTALRLDE